MTGSFKGSLCSHDGGKKRDTGIALFFAKSCSFYLPFMHLIFPFTALLLLVSPHYFISLARDIYMSQ